MNGIQTVDELVADHDDESDEVTAELHDGAGDEQCFCSACGRARAARGAASMAKFVASHGGFYGPALNLLGDL